SPSSRTASGPPPTALRPSPAHRRPSSFKQRRLDSRPHRVTPADLWQDPWHSARPPVGTRSEGSKLVAGHYLAVNRLEHVHVEPGATAETTTDIRDGRGRPA